jgi:hypothetical protein
MYLGTILFLIVMLLVTPQTRAFIMGSLASATAFIHNWAPFSYGLMVMLLVACIGAIYALHSWPKTVVPESPMAKYRREEPMDDEF